MRRIAITAFLLAAFFAGDCNTGTDFSPLDPARTDIPVQVDAAITDISTDSLDGLLQLDFWITPPRYFKVEWSGRNTQETIAYGERRYPDIHKTTSLDDTVSVQIYVAFNRLEPFALLAYIRSYYRADRDTFVWLDCPLPDPPKFRGACTAQWLYGDKVR
jgi:hypothetical protein